MEKEGGINKGGKERRTKGDRSEREWKTKEEEVEENDNLRGRYKRGEKWDGSQGVERRKREVWVERK